jgi:hypothetical protein
MYISGERAWCLRRVILGRGVCCNKCACSGSIIVKSAQWSMRSPLTLDVSSKCGNCGTGPRLSFRCKRPGVAASTAPTKAYAKAVHSPGRTSIYVCGLILLAPLRTCVHRSAWKRESATFACRMPHSPARWPPYGRPEASRLLNVNHCMLDVRIKMRLGAYASSRQDTDYTGGGRWSGVHGGGLLQEVRLS